MEFHIFSLVIFAAAIHAFWNFVAKKIAGNIAAIWLGLCCTIILLSPFCLKVILTKNLMPAAFPFIIATGIIHSLYFFFVGKCYEKGEISSVYPIARGVGVGGTAIVAVTVLSEKITTMGGTGILLICLGILGVGISDSATRESAHAFGYALVVGFLIVCYSIVDKVGVSLADPVIDIYSMFLITTIPGAGHIPGQTAFNPRGLV